MDARRLTTAQIIGKSTLVVVGRIVGIRVLGEARQSGQGVRVKMWKVEVDPEYWLRGHLDGRFAYYLFNYSNDVVQNGDFEWLSRGDKRLFFLTNEGATIRAVADLYKTSVALPAGNLPNLRAVDESGLGERVARLLLTPPSGAPTKAFALAIPDVTPEALRASGYSLVASLLARLSENESADIRREACLTSYEQLFGEGECLRKIETDGAPAALVQRILRDRERRAYLEKVVGDALRSGWHSPLLHYYTTGVEQSDPNSVVEFFQFLSGNPDPVFRVSAEKELRIISSRK